jgi:hypothetical protein
LCRDLRDREEEYQKRRGTERTVEKRRGQKARESKPLRERKESMTPSTKTLSLSARYPVRRSTISFSVGTPAKGSLGEGGRGEVPCERGEAGAERTGEGSKEWI